LDASGISGLVIDNLSVAQLLAAASTQPFGATSMRNVFSNNLLLLGAAALLLAIGLALSLYARDFLWLARFGALITGIGIIVISRPAVTGKDILLQVVMDESGLTSTDPEYYRRRNEPIPDAVMEDQKSRKAVGILGPFLTLLGTVIWGFADLLNFAVGFRR
jgi:hypothetical protein